MRPPTKLQVFASFRPKKCYNPLSPPVLSRFISASLFSVPQVENKVKRTTLCGVAEIQEAVTDKLKKVQKEEFSAAFQKVYGRTKACIYANGAYIELKKKVCVFLMRLQFLKKSILKRLDRTVYFRPHCVIMGLTETR